MKNLENYKTKKGLDIKKYNFFNKLLVVLFLVIIFGTFWFLKENKDPPINDQLDQKKIEHWDEVSI